MAEYNESQYQAPIEVQQAWKGADEAGDLRYLHAASAVIKIGGIPVVALESLNINQSTPMAPIHVIGSLAPLGFDAQGVSVNISGQLIQMANMSLNQSSFYPANESDLIANINTVFIIDISMMDYSKGSSAIPTGNFIRVLNCKNTGSSITINPNTNLKDSFTAVGTMMTRDWSKLAEFNLREQGQ